MLDETIEALRSVALDADDAGGHFPAMYARVTDRIRSEVAAGRFDDGEAMVGFAQAFASRYLLPMSGAAPMPTCWRSARDEVGNDRLLIVQHLLLGINAHVNHDLPLVVVQLADQRGEISALRSDFDAINTVLAETMPAVLRDLGRVSRWVNVLAAQGGRRVFKFSLEAARHQAWRSAQALFDLDPEQRAAEVTGIDGIVTGLARVVTRPGRPFSWMVAGGRRLEEHDPHAVTRRLLGQLA
jgi:hypothetical protein